MTFKKISATEWQWQDKGHHRAVRYFESQGTLIWSVWIETSTGPIYEDGISQKSGAFLEQGAPAGIEPPQPLIDEVRALFTGEAPKKGIWGWFRR